MPPGEAICDVRLEPFVPRRANPGRPSASAHYSAKAWHANMTPPRNIDGGRLASAVYRPLPADRSRYPCPITSISARLAAFAP
jgi:hypothetical protein